MNTMNTMTRTEDTREPVTVPALPADDRAGDGYDWMATLDGTEWAALPAWGEDGWDCGAWPLIIVAVAAATDDRGRLYGVGTYVEGDTAARWFRTREAHHAAITAEAFFHWKSGQADGPADLPEHVADLEAKFRTPYLPDTYVSDPGVSERAACRINARQAAPRPQGGEKPGAAGTDCRLQRIR